MKGLKLMGLTLAASTIAFHFRKLHTLNKWLKGKITKHIMVFT